MSRFPHGITTVATYDSDNTGEMYTQTLIVKGKASVDSFVCASSATFSASATIDGSLHVATNTTLDGNLKVSGGAHFGYKGITATDGDITLSTTTPSVVVASSTGANSTVDLPGASVSAGLWFLIKHSGTSSKTIAIKDSGSTALLTMASQHAALCFCSSLGWFCSQLAAS